MLGRARLGDMKIASKWSASCLGPLPTFGDPLRVPTLCPIVRNLPSAPGPLCCRGRVVAATGCGAVSGRGHHGPAVGLPLSRTGAGQMFDRSSRPRLSPNQTQTRTERRIIKVRVIRRWGPARIGYLLGIHPFTVHRVLTRYGVARLRWLDRPTDRVARRIETAAVGELVHVGVKKVGKIPTGGGCGCGGAPWEGVILRPTRLVSSTGAANYCVAVTFCPPPVDRLSG